MQESYIDTAEGLQRICEQLRRSRFVTLDTEFVRERSYYPRLCLIQLADEQQTAVIDPIAITDLTPLRALLMDPAVTKVLHSARQDLEIFYHLFGELPTPLWDTQIAATLLGHGDQVGYGALVKELLGIELDKSHSRTDWEQRPLDTAQLRYAADDVIHLVAVYQRLLAELERRGRSSWLAEDFAALTQPQLYHTDPEEAWERIKGRQKLRGVQLAALQLLAAWREQRAQEDDLPRRWVASDEVLLDVARILPESTDKLARIRGLPKPVAERHGKALLALVAEARALPKQAWPRLEQGERLTLEQEAIADAMMAIVRLRGAEQQVSPSAIATRRELEALLLGGREIALLHGWRGALVGEQLQRLVAGEVALRVRQGQLELMPVADPTA